VDQAHEKLEPTWIKLVRNSPLWLDHPREKLSISVDHARGK
jgi:hypothetical protein